MKMIVDGPYQCHYCGKSGTPLVQLGDEASNSMAWEEPFDPEAKRISPEDSNNVEICKECLSKALTLFG
jgi:hypothetical protein